MRDLAKEWDAVVVGSGPNGLSAAVLLAEAGISTLLVEAKNSLGGGMRSLPLTLPGFLHDVCSSVHPLALSSPCLRRLPLSSWGLEWIHPEIPLAHPFDDGTAALLCRSIEETGETLSGDGTVYRRMMEPLAARWGELEEDLLAPLHVPKHPLAALRFGWLGCRSAEGLLCSRFRGARARALFAGLSAHSLLPLDRVPTAAFGLILAILGHVVGWPIAKGGSQRIADALAAHFASLGGVVEAGKKIGHLKELPRSQLLFLDVAPRGVLEIAGEALPGGYTKKLEGYRYGPGVFKADWALSQPIPWRAAECRRAGTVHLGGSWEEIAAYEKDVWEGRMGGKPYVLLVQPTLFDPTRAPPGRHTAWAYCHVPHASGLNRMEAIENQIERFAPGFKECILSRHALSALEMERYNPNYVGGDINGGVQDLGQLFSRPSACWAPYSTPIKGLYLCSSSTPPGGGVHGLCGYYAVQEALK